MDIIKEEQQRQEFRNILFELAESQLSLKEKSDRSKIYQRLEKLYYSRDSNSINCRIGPNQHSFRTFLLC